MIVGCPFCEIIQHDHEHQIEASTRDVIVITPTNPVTLGHKLVIPKIHVENVLSDPLVTERTFLDLVTIGRVLGTQMNIITSVGRDATQTIFHMHVHLVPRRPGDGLQLPWT